MSSTLSSVRSSPIPDLAYDSYRSLSLRDQTLLRRQLANQPGEPHPQQEVDYFPSQQQSRMSYNNPPPPQANATLRSRCSSEKVVVGSTPASSQAVKRRPSSFFLSQGKAYNLEGYAGETLAFWILLGILIILVLGNTILTCLIFGVVRVGTRMESIEFLPRMLKFYGETDLDVIIKRDGILQGFLDQPMEIAGEDGGQVHLWIHEGSQPSLTVEKGIINISQVEEFRVVDRKGKQVFSTNTPTLGLPRGVQKLDVRVAKVNRITSAVNASLQLVSTTFAYLKGSEGTHLEGRQILFKADQDILMKSVNGSIILQGLDGVHINVHDLPLVRDSGVTRKSHTYTTHGKKEAQFQLCMCMPQGKLYRVEIPVDNISRPQRQRVGCHTPKHLPC